MKHLSIKQISQLASYLNIPIQKVIDLLSMDENKKDNLKTKIIMKIR
jgi:hypothetical protein